jgi:hypothetical protein
LKPVAAFLVPNGAQFLSLLKSLTCGKVTLMDMTDWLLWIIPVIGIPILMLSSTVSGSLRSKFGITLWPKKGIIFLLAIVTLCTPSVCVMIFRDCVRGPPIAAGAFLCVTLLMVLAFNLHRLHWRSSLIASAFHIVAILVLLAIGSLPMAVLFAMASMGGAGYSGCT